jgi:anaerobic nitric oxide reductase flavorubredoxin
MAFTQILPNIYSVGVIDWNVRTFHGHTYNTHRGSTYNAYLIRDEKIALVDTVYGPFADEFIRNIREIIDPAKIDYIIANHVETDHSGALPALMKLCPQAKIYCSAKCKEGLYRNYYGNWDMHVVKTGDSLNLGKRTLQFIEAPMIHWPDSMFTYCPQDALLMPNDAFGQHYATSERFDDETDQCALMDEARKYYANILWPLGPIILKKIEEIQKMNIPIKMIAPSHGIIWRKDPGKIINAYVEWARNTTQPKVVIVYETMWKSTEKMAAAIADELAHAGVAFKLYDVGVSDRTDIINDMLDARGFLLGSSTHDNDMLPAMASFVAFLKGLKPKGRSAGVFGSYGWAGGAIKEIEHVLQAAGIPVVVPGLGVQYVPNPGDIEKCRVFAREFAQAIIHPNTRRECNTPGCNTPGV